MTKLHVTILALLLSSATTLASQSPPKAPLVVIYETDESQVKPSAANFLFQQINEPEIRDALTDVRVAGVGQEWKGWGSKAKHVASELQNVDPDRLVVVSDSRDVLLNNLDAKSVQQFVKNFESLTKTKSNAIVVGAESQCCVSALTHAKPGDFLNDDLTRTGKSETCNSGKGSCLDKGERFQKPWKDAMQRLAREQGAKTTKNVYPNTGIIVGKAKDILNAYSILDMKETEDDQALFTELMLKNPNLIVLDYEQQLIGNNAWTEGMDGCIFDWDADTRKFKHPNFNTVPAFLHFQGKFYECYGKLARSFGYKGNMRRKLADAPLGNNYGTTTPQPASPATRVTASSLLGLVLMALLVPASIF